MKLVTLLLFAVLCHGQLTWTKHSSNYRTVGCGNYSSFWVDNNKVTYYTGANAAIRAKRYGPYDWTGKLFLGTGTTSYISKLTNVINRGPDQQDRRQFRAVAVARGSATQYWALIEASYAYASGRPYSRLAYASSNGVNWAYMGDMTLDGQTYHVQDASVGLLYDPTKPGVVDVSDPSNNRFIFLVGGPLSIAVSANGLDFHTAAVIPWTTLFPGDSPTFPTFARTPYGWHVMAGNGWGKNTGVRYWRHIFSADLVTWKVLETASPAKVNWYYKTGSLSYDPSTNRLWVLGVVGETTGNKLWWTAARAF